MYGSSTNVAPRRDGTPDSEVFLLSSNIKLSVQYGSDSGRYGERISQEWGGEATNQAFGPNRDKFRFAMKVGWQCGILLLLVVSSASLLSGGTPKPPSKHRITFTFDYDFRVTPACSPEIKQGCVQQFNLYEISPGLQNRVKLGSIPASAGATGYVKGISATTKSFLWIHGKHKLAVSAQMPNGLESDLSNCTTIVKIN